MELVVRDVLVLPSVVIARLAKNQVMRIVVQLFNTRPVFGDFLVRCSEGLFFEH